MLWPVEAGVLFSMKATVVGMVFFICICGFFCIFFLGANLGLQGSQGYMAVVVCPHCHNDGTPVYEGVSRVSVPVPFLISLGFPLFLVVMKEFFRWGYGFRVEFVEGCFQLR